MIAILAAWKERKRYPKGHPLGGKFMPAEGSAGDVKNKLEKDENESKVKDALAEIAKGKGEIAKRSKDARLDTQKQKLETPSPKTVSEDAFNDVEKRLKRGEAVGDKEFKEALSKITDPEKRAHLAGYKVASDVAKAEGRSYSYRTIDQRKADEAEATKAAAAAAAQQQKSAEQRRKDAETLEKIKNATTKGPRTARTVEQQRQFDFEAAEKITEPPTTPQRLADAGATPVAPIRPRSQGVLATVTNIAESSSTVKSAFDALGIGTGSVISGQGTLLENIQNRRDRSVQQAALHGTLGTVAGGMALNKLSEEGVIAALPAAAWLAWESVMAVSQLGLMGRLNRLEGKAQARADRHARELEQRQREFAKEQYKKSAKGRAAAAWDWFQKGI